MIRLSIIVPFYNVEKYIEECIRSLYAQDIPMEEYEVICVDDCSPDGSRAIVEQLQKEYPTLRLLTHSENKRQGGARNTGLREAKGEYVWFVDSDDEIMPNVIKGLLSRAEENNLDILQFNYKKGDQNIAFYVNYNVPVMSGQEYLFDKNVKRWDVKLSGPWCQIYKADFLKKYQILFQEYIQYEDTDFVLTTYLKASRVSYVAEYAYYYRINSESTTQKSTPVIFAWRINQVARCATLIPEIKDLRAQMLMRKMIQQTFSSWRSELKAMSLSMIHLYKKNISKETKSCRDFMNWRTWCAIRYGITFFI